MSATFFLSQNNRQYTQQDLIEALKAAGIQAGDEICVHSSLLIGKPLVSKQEFLQIILEALLSCIGSNGTLIMPTFTYSFCHNEDYDKKNSRTNMGALNEYFRKQDGVVRTNDPIFSFALVGKNTQFYMEDCQSCFANNSVYARLAERKGKIILLGLELVGYTFSHFIEEKAQVPYRYFKTFTGNIIDEKGNTYTKSIDYFVRKLDERSDLSVEKQINILKAKHNFKQYTFAQAPLISIEAKRYLDDTLAALKANPYALLVDE